MGEGAQYARYRGDAEVLALIGAHVAPQVRPITVRIPRTVADAAVAAWNRDELEDLDDETPAQAELRDQAATLALIGLAITTRGVPDGDELVLDMEVTDLGAAIRAARNAPESTARMTREVAVDPPGPEADDASPGKADAAGPRA